MNIQFFRWVLFEKYLLISVVWFYLAVSKKTTITL
jgi:hypothetical protein